MHSGRFEPSIQINEAYPDAVDAAEFRLQAACVRMFADARGSLAHYLRDGGLKGRVQGKSSCFDKMRVYAPTLRNFNVRAAFIPVSQKAQELAKRLLAFETASWESRAADVEVQFRVCDKLRGPLAALAGSMGFQALLYRALVLTKAEVPRLASAEIGPDGCLDNLPGIEPRLNADEAAEGEVVLIGNMMDLLCTFLGETLALRLIQDVWPDASFNDRDNGRDMKA